MKRRGLFLAGWALASIISTISYTRGGYSTLFHFTRALSIPLLVLGFFYKSREYPSLYDLMVQKIKKHRALWSLFITLALFALLALIFGKTDALFNEELRIFENTPHAIPTKFYPSPRVNNLSLVVTHLFVVTLGFIVNRILAIFKRK